MSIVSITTDYGVTEMRILLTAELRHRTQSSLTESCQSLEKEMGYSASVRDQKQVAFLESHINKLSLALDRGYLIVGM
jgi:beta-glucosidase/6-phospho-beta-glucosidase/beta-galactosidase